MNAVALQSFGFGEQLVRAVERDGGAWFVANDVCGALEIANPRNAVARLTDDEKDDVHIMDAIGREQRTTIISESGMYALVFTSRKAAAQAFRKWVTQEVLPAIRKTGKYEAANDAAAQDSLETPEEFERRRLALTMVGVAQRVFGKAAARRAWLLAGLPDLSVPEDDLLPNFALSPVHRPVNEWMHERCQWQEGYRTATRDLYADYVDWCLHSGKHAASLPAFGKFLTACGIATIKSNMSHRIGLRLKDE